MKRIKHKSKALVIVCSMIVVLCGCNLFVTDKDKFYIDETIDDCLSGIDIEKAGKDIVIPTTVGDTTVRKIDLADPYYSKIDSLDVSQVKELESFTINLFDPKNKSKLKELDFSKNKKLKLIVISQTMALKKITFNSNCEYIFIDGSHIKSVNLQSLEKLEKFSYYNGPLEELDISNNNNLEYITIENCNVKSLDVSKNPKLKKITVDEGTQIIGPTTAQIEYNKRTE